MRAVRSSASLHALGVVAALGACTGGGDTSGGAETGTDGETRGDGSAAESSSGDASTLDSSVNDTGGDDSASGDGAGDDGSSDVVFGFDGFADAAGSDGNICTDDDLDGFTTCGGDCNDHDSQINPCAFDTNDPNDPVGHDGIDNDCDGSIDNLITCESGLAPGHDTSAAHYASAADLCDNPMCKRVQGATWYGPNNSNAHRVTGHMGSSGQFNPKLGKLMAFFSTGIADDLTDNSSYRTGDGTELGNQYTNPMPAKVAQYQNPCNSITADETSTVPAVHDYTELRMTIAAPSNAGSFSFDFAFFSEEYPTYVCQGFNDSFDVIQTSHQFPQGFQIAFDGNGHRINVNNSFFTDCNSAQPSWGYGYTHTCNGALSLLKGTGYEAPYCCTFLSDGNGNHGSGGTDWLTTTSPINPGETFSLSWILFDEHDGILDSSVILDHFRWHSTTLSNPVTGR